MKRSSPRRSAAKKPTPAKRSRLRETAAGVYRDAILAAAERVFGERGFAATKMTDIAREAGMAAGTLYNYFDSKEEIFQSLLAQRGDELLLRVGAVFDREPDPARRLSQVVETSLSFFDDHRAILAMFVQLGAHGELHARQICGAAGQTRHESLLRLFERAVRDGVGAGTLRSDVPAQHLVAFLTGTITGFWRAWILGQEKTSLSARAEVIAELFLRGAGAAS